VVRREALAEHRGRGFQQEATQAAEQVTQQLPCKPTPFLQDQTGKSWEQPGLISELALLPMG